MKIYLTVYSNFAVTYATICGANKRTTDKNVE